MPPNPYEERAFLIAAVSTSDDAIIGMTLDTERITLWNAGAERLYGWRAEEIVGRPFTTLVPEEEHAEFERHRHHLASSTVPSILIDTVRKRKDGTLVNVSVRVSTVRDPGSGEPLGLCAIARDITERIKADGESRAIAEANLAATQEQLASAELLHTIHEETAEILESINDAFYAVDENFDFTYINRNAEQRWNRRREDLIGKNQWAEFPQIVGTETHRMHLLAARERQPVRYEVHSVMLHKWIEVSIYPKGKGLAIYSRDIEDRKALERERERQLTEAVERADHDPLTGLLNHRAFYDRLRAEISRMEREKGTVSLVVFDLVNFKFFNEAFGHLVGDEVLQQVATAFRSCCREYDVLARLGGDEFALMMVSAGAPEARRIVERIRTRVEEMGFTPAIGESQPIPLGFSFGIATFPDEASTAVELATLADQRLLLSKKGEVSEVASLLREELDQSIEGFSMLDALVTGVDNKDRYTRKHSEDVMVYALQIAEEMGISATAIESLRIAALLHDVGKIGIPDRILRLPTRLSSTEYDVVKKHSLMGAAIIGAVPGLEHVLPAVRHHHEAWNGSGYPDGLREEEIPLAARILAVADAFSAMTTNRPYRKALPSEQALAILESGAGVQWDRECVRAFLRSRSSPEAETN